MTKKPDEALLLRAAGRVPYVTDDEKKIILTAIASRYYKLNRRHSEKFVSFKNELMKIAFLPALLPDGKLGMHKLFIFLLK